MVEKVLVANRGEIACRVLHTLRCLGVRSVAVFSEADGASRHVAEADESVYLGPARAAESYLRQDRLLEAATSTGAAATMSKMECNHVLFIQPSNAALSRRRPAAVGLNDTLPRRSA